MSELSEKELLAQLAGMGQNTSDADPYAAIGSNEPSLDQIEQEGTPDKLDELLEKINDLAAMAEAEQAETPDAPETDDEEAEPCSLNTFVPIEPESFDEAGLTDSEVETLILKYLLARGDASGRDIADQVKLPFVLVDQLLRSMKNEQLVGHRSSAPMNDYQYQLNDIGRERARRHSHYCSYFGAAPVSLKDYVASVYAQSLTGQRPGADDLRRSLGDLTLSREMLDRLGPAVNSGRGLFLFGPPGNGKTSIAERVTEAFGKEAWIPRAIGIDGEIVRVFDPVNHDEIPLKSEGGLLDSRKIDKRWVRIRRPTIVAGGELTMSQLEVTINTSTGISEAPLQLKSNCGTLVIDDFGRQRMRIDELLNRWIVPLEKRYDFLNLPNGKKVKVPFDQLIIFSTNLEPRDLVDEAFLRRIPYKIEVIDPTEQQFRELLETMAGKLGVHHRSEAVDHLIETHYRQTGRPLRFCQPRDLLMQVRNYCVYQNREPEMSAELFDKAVEIYFAVM